MIKILNLDYIVPEKKILNNVSIEIKKGETVGVIGPNGSGKSTLLKNIYKVLKYDKGSVLIKDKEVKHISNKEMAKMLAVVSQDHESSFDFSVKDVVMMGRYAKKNHFYNFNEEDHQKCDDVLEQIGIKDLKHQSFLTLSGGEKQKVMLSRAMIQETEILILDEPTNHLDIGSQLNMLKMIKTIDKTILLALHDINFALTYCDRIYVLDNGSVYDQGLPDQVITRKLIKDLYGADSQIIRHDGRSVVVFE